MTLLLEDLALITAKTLEHYNERAAEFWEGTRDHDVKQNIEALLRHIRGAPPLRILDLGCGPGRDLAAFRALGHEPIGLEGSPPLAAMARKHSGCEVWEQDFLTLKLPSCRFDGIFANASLFHVPRQELPRVLSELHAALKPDGVLFTSNPGGITRRAGIAGGMGCITTSNRGARFLKRRRSRSWSTTIVHRGYRSSGSLGSQAYGGRTVQPVRSNNPLERTVKGRDFVCGWCAAAQLGRLARTRTAALAQHVWLLRVAMQSFA
jgi:SAM-dependent methyltransferase